VYLPDWKYFFWFPIVMILGVFLYYSREIVGFMRRCVNKKDKDEGEKFSLMNFKSSKYFFSF
jgi:hypothetical protein